MHMMSALHGRAATALIAVAMQWQRRSANARQPSSERGMHRSHRFLLRMSVFLGWWRPSPTALQRPLLAAFLGNPAVNGVILGVLVGRHHLHLPPGHAARSGRSTGSTISASAWRTAI